MRPQTLSRTVGYTLVEMLLVISIIGILAAISLPRMGRIRDQSQLSSARTRFTRGVMAARQAAIQRGKHAFFNVENSVLWVYVDTDGDDDADVTVTPNTDITSLYGVTVTPSTKTTIEYDPRGIATQSDKQVFHFEHTSSGFKDSLCVSRLGNTIRTACP